MEESGRVSHFFAICMLISFGSWGCNIMVSADAQTNQTFSRHYGGAQWQVCVLGVWGYGPRDLLPAQLVEARDDVCIGK
jgi:hypothetical protein